MWSQKTVRRFVWFWLSVISLMLITLFVGMAQAAEQPSRAALKHKHELIRISREVWGLDAPVALFAAQIHQESLWNTQALSRAGAQGMAQFMPGTATWWCKINNLSAADCQPNNPAWAMRAMVGYDLFLYKRVLYGPTGYDHFWATLRSYNGGLGHWLREASLAKVKTREEIDAQCGKARRHISHCKENLGYPKKIMNVWQPIYLGWGRGVMMQGGSA